MTALMHRSKKRGRQCYRVRRNWRNGKDHGNCYFVCIRLSVGKCKV